MHTTPVLHRFRYVSICVTVAGLAMLALFSGRRAPLGLVESEVRAEVVPGYKDPFPFPPEYQNVNLLNQTRDEAHAKSHGCVACHVGAVDPHEKASLNIGCVDCHGGDPNATTKEHAHVTPRIPAAWVSSANPVRSYTLLNHESPEFVRFVNPGDLRVAHIGCGTAACHPKEVLHNKKSMMTHGCMLWGAALYNNGAFPLKRARFGESYSMHGVPQRMQTVPPPSPAEMKLGVVPFLDPLPRFEVTQPGNILRIFERGGKMRPEVGIPERMEEPGRPFLTRLSNRGLGTENRTDPVFIGLQKTRLLDPTLNFLGTNDHPGDYRSSGCTSCHMIYANDRSRVHSGPYAVDTNQGLSFSSDPTIPKDEPGHPMHHRFAPSSGVPTSQCMVCHMHPGTTVLNSYVGYMWWDEETDGELMYPAHPVRKTAEQLMQDHLANPEGGAAKGLWSDPAFLDNLIDLNTQTKKTQFADFHGHGWAFRAVYKKDRKGQYLDHTGKVIEAPTNEDFRKGIKVPEEIIDALAKHSPDDPAATAATAENPHLPNRDGVPVHLLDIHMEKGMHCVDCHFVQDVHGNGRLQMEVRAAVEIQCIDCHGTVDQYATLRTSGPASYTSDPDKRNPYDPEEPSKGRNLLSLRARGGKPRFERRGNKIIQRSLVDEKLSWEVTQVKDTLVEGHPSYNLKARLAKTIRMSEKGEFVWGDVPADSKTCAHANEKMSCIACHSSWNPSCYGCHLPQKANQKTPHLHWDGDVTRNQVAYNFQTLRDEVYMLGVDGTATGNRIGPARSSCAIHVGSYNANRESIYVQQQTISSEGLSGIAFSTNVPHTVRGSAPKGKDGIALDKEAAYAPGHSETKSCTDCHVSTNEDNNAILAQLIMQGTNYLNFIGRYCWVAAGEHGLAAVTVTEQDEPQAVIGSYLHKLAFPDEFAEHTEHDGELKEYYEHPGKDISDNIIYPGRGTNVLSVQLRGEYLYAACGPAGLKVIDVAFVDHKGFSERIVSTPVSPLGQRFYVNTKYATYVAAPATTAPDPTRTHIPENEEAAVHALYAYLYVADKYEGLILVGAGTLLDGNPNNNFLKRDLTFNPNGLLCGARHIAIVGTYAYVSCDAGLVVVDLNKPLEPKVTTVLGHDVLVSPRSVQVQFRYGFVCDEDRIVVLDTTDIAHPKPVAELEVPDPHNIYIARTYAYVACGEHGMYILDVEKPLEPKIDQVFDGGGCINDLHDIKLGVTYASEFAYLADGKNGMRVVQLTSPDTPGNDGFSPRPAPQLIGTFHLPRNGHALAISKGVDRDRAVDESGNQLSVFGRVGARPMSAEQIRRMYLHNGKVWKVSDDPTDSIYGKPQSTYSVPRPLAAPQKNPSGLRR